MLFLGDDRLADGFRLIGFETFPSPGPETVDSVFRDLLRRRDKAFAIVDDRIYPSHMGFRFFGCVIRRVQLGGKPQRYD